MHAVSYDFPAETHYTSEALADYSSQLVESSLIGISGWAERTRKLILRLAANDDTVCLEGEAGTGKSLIASLIHQCSPRREGPFVTLTLTSASIEVTRSVLLGSTQRYSTEGLKDEKGLIELAREGTLYIKRLSHTPTSSLATDDLLNLLSQLRFNNRLHGHARIVLGLSVQSDRLDVGTGLRNARDFETVRTLPLRKRPEDVEALTSHLVNQHCLQNQKELRTVSPEALKAMSSYDWPHNVFELKALVRNLVAQSGPPLIEASLLPAYVCAPVNCDDFFPASGIDLDQEIKRREMELICAALRHCRGLQAKAARLLRIKPTTLFMKIQRYGIDVEAFR